MGVNRDDASGPSVADARTLAEVAADGTFAVDKQFTLGYLNAMVLCAQSDGSDPEIALAMAKLNKAVSNRLYGAGKS
jgi:hypothetical protein